MESALSASKRIDGYYGGRSGEMKMAVMMMMVMTLIMKMTMEMIM